MLTSATMNSVNGESSSQEDAEFSSSVPINKNKTVDADVASTISSSKTETSPVRIEAQHNLHLQTLMSQPRCVLCSKAFEDGDQVSHSNNPSCHHEYHTKCITKWLISKNRNCPVCKNTFMVLETDC